MTRRGWMALAFAGLLLAASLPLVLGGAGSRLAAFLVDPAAPGALPAPPTIRLDAPAPGEGVGPAVTLAGEARATPGGAVQDIELRVDGGRWASLPDAPRGAPAVPFRADLDLDPGDHLLEVRAWDGASFSLPARSLVRAGATPAPTVAIVTPADGSGLASGDATVTGTLRNGPARVVVEAAGATTDATVEGSVWRAKVALPPGVSSIVARAIASQESLPARATVSVGGPTLAVVAPQEGDAFGSAGDPTCSCVLVAGAVSPDAARVEASLDGEPAANATLEGASFSWRIPMDSLVSGPHRVALMPVSAAGAPGAPREVRFLARTPRVVAVTGDEAPRLTGTPLSFSLAGNATARWTLDGAPAGEGPSVDITLASPGPHALSAATEDGRGRPATAEVPLLALNRPPIAALHAQAGLAVADTPFRAEASDPDGSVARYAWEFGDGSATTTTSGPETMHRYASEGLYRANLTIFDDLGAASPVATLLVAIANAPPVASFWHEPDAPTVFDDAQFTDASQDPEGALVARHWDFGDGATAEGAFATHRFATRGDHTVTLRVEDAAGAAAIATQVVHVQDVAPQPAFTWSPLAPRAGEEVAFADASRKPDGAIVDWSWSFGGRGPLATHAFPAPGAYDITLNVTDDFGQRASATRTIRVGDAAPEVRAILADPARPLARQPVAFRALANDALGAIASLRWDFGDGNASDAMAPTHAYARSGSYRVAVLATSPANVTALANVTIAVEDAPPVARLDAPGGEAGDPLVLDGSGSADPDGRVARYVFDADGDGLPDCDGPSPRCSFAYPAAGLYLANLTVQDDEGATASDTLAVAILAAPPEKAPPQVVVQKPLPGSALSGPTVLSGVATGNRSVVSVDAQLRTGSRALALGVAPWMPAQGIAPWRLALDTAAFPDGPYTLVVRATDSAGVQGFAFVPVEIRNGPQETPLALRIANAPLDPVGPDYDLEGSAYHPQGVSAVRWRMDEGPWSDPDGPPQAFTLPLRGLLPGLHVVVVDAYHGVSEKREATVEVRVASPPPALAVDEPPGPLAYGLLHAAGRTVGNGSVEWRLDSGVWRRVDATGPEWRLDAPTGDLPAGRHALSLRAVGPEGAAGDARTWSVKVVRAVGDSRFAGWGAEEIDGPAPAPERRAPLDLMAPLAALALAAAFGAARRRL